MFAYKISHTIHYVRINAHLLSPKYVCDSILLTVLMSEWRRRTFCCDIAPLAITRPHLAEFHTTSCQAEHRGIYIYVHTCIQRYIYIYLYTYIYSLTSDWTRKNLSLCMYSGLNCAFKFIYIWSTPEG